MGCRGYIVGMGGQVTALNHVHPCFPVSDQACFESFPRGVFGTIQIADAAAFQKIFQRVPRQFVGVFDGLDQSLFFEF